MSDWTAMDLVTTTGKYSDRDGVEKNRWLTCGTLWMRSGEPSQVVLDVMPAPQPDQKTGRLQYKLSVFARRPKVPETKAERTAVEPGVPPRKSSEPEFDDDIPF
jgi:hypothetical protein